MDEYWFKIVLSGDYGAGKSSLIHRYKFNLFPKETIPTIGVEFILNHEVIDEIKVKLQVWDWSWNERFGNTKHISQIYL